MTLPSETTKVQYSGNDATTSFPVTFVFWDADDLRVISTVVATGVETVWTRGSQYTISGGSGATGTLTVSTSPTDYTPATGTRLTIKSDLDNTQETTLPAGGPFPSASVEQEFDKIVRMIQQLVEQIARAILLSESSTTTGITFPEPDAGLFIRWNSDEDGLENADIGDLGAVGLPISLADGGLGVSHASISALLTTLGFTTFTKTLIDDASAATALATLTAAGQGLQTIWVPAFAMRPTVSNGCAPLAGVETTAGRPDMVVLDFDASADEHAQFSVAFPKSWDEGAITFQVFHTTTATDTDGVAWGLQGVACSDGDTIDVVYGTPIVVTDAYQSTAEDCYVTAVSAAVTIAGTPAAADDVMFRIFRDVSDGADTATEDARLLGVKIFFTTDAATDA